MRSFPSALCAVLVFCLLPIRNLAAEESLISIGHSNGHLLFEVRGITVAVVPGDFIDNCLVTEQGLSCDDGGSVPLPEPPAALSRPEHSDETECSARLARQEQHYRQRHIDSLEYFSRALQQKNHELVSLSMERNTLRANALAACPQTPAAPEQQDEESRTVADMPLPAADEAVPLIIITGASVNLRQAPSTAGEIIDQALAGDIFELRETQNGWYRINLDDDSAAWLDSTFCRRLPEEGSTRQDLAPPSQIFAPPGNCRQGPGLRYQNMTRTETGDMRPVLARTRNWTRIALKDDRACWLHNSITTANFSPNGNAAATPTQHEK